VAARYGPDVDLRQMDGPGGRRVMVTIHPVRVVAADVGR